MGCNIPETNISFDQLSCQVQPMGYIRNKNAASPQVADYFRS
jgi:hypothetical protein